MAKLPRRVLEEMVYERLLTAIDPDRVLELGRDLDRCLESAVEVAHGPQLDPAAVKLALLRRAVVRVGETICDLAGRTMPLV